MVYQLKYLFSMGKLKALGQGKASLVWKVMGVVCRSTRRGQKSYRNGRKSPKVNQEGFVVRGVGRIAHILKWEIMKSTMVMVSVLLDESVGSHFRMAAEEWHRELGWSIRLRSLLKKE
jgi:hypothetical protein